MIWLLGLPIPPALVVVFAAVTLPAALVAAFIGVRLLRSRESRIGRKLLGGLLVAYGATDVLTLVYFLAFWRGSLVPPPG